MYTVPNSYSSGTKLTRIKVQVGIYTVLLADVLLHHANWHGMFSLSTATSCMPHSFSSRELILIGTPFCNLLVRGFYPILVPCCTFQWPRRINSLYSIMLLSWKLKTCRNILQQTSIKDDSALQISIIIMYVDSWYEVATFQLVSAP